MFIEDYCCGRLEFLQSSPVWARQLNVETRAPMIHNETSLWVLGLKTERPNLVIDTLPGGVSEVWGGLVYPVQQVPTDVVAFRSREAHMTLVYASSAYGDETRDYTLHIEDERNGVRRIVARFDTDRRGSSFGSAVVGYATR